MVERLNEKGLKMHYDKCEFFQNSKLSYLGHKIDAQGIHVLESEVKAIVDACQQVCKHYDHS